MNQCLIRCFDSSYMRYDSSYGGSLNYQIPPFGDSYRPDRDRDMPPSPSSHLPYYERDRLDDRDFYRRVTNTNNDYDNRYRNTPSNSTMVNNNNASSSNPVTTNTTTTNNNNNNAVNNNTATPIRTGPLNRPSWSSNKERMLDRDRPEHISTNLDIRSGRTSPVTPKERSAEIVKPEDKKEEIEAEQGNFIFSGFSSCSLSTHFSFCSKQVNGYRRSYDRSERYEIQHSVREG